ncbi:metallophosphoesterase [Brevibacillus sp. NPDC058079]|uniref:metallophosphoesterase family protein n=1 Tax=Brevibacillus sp. NPDC058079 TaxID=3346330 RepID=UPI0036E6A6EF
MRVLRSFDLISDVHIDFWVNVDSNPFKMQKKTDAFVDSIVPDRCSKVLVIAGDMGHYNNQNQLFLKSLKRYYQYIIVVRGNHDLYLVSGQQRKKYKYSSDNRWNEMKEFIKETPGAFVLEGDIVTLDGITFGGTGMWYDYSYGIIEYGKTKEEIVQLWRKEMNDSKLIQGLPDFSEEASRFNAIIEKSDVIVTHVGGDWSRLSNKSRYVQGLTSSFYFFDGSKWMDKLKGKTWCFGHVHDHSDYTHNGCRFINNAKGYPRDNPDARIKNISI